MGASICSLVEIVGFLVFLSRYALGVMAKSGGKRKKKNCDDSTFSTIS